MLVESLYCKPFPPRILHHDSGQISYREYLLSLLNFKPGDSWTIPHLARKMDMTIWSGTEFKLRLNTFSNANFPPPEVFPICTPRIYPWISSIWLYIIYILLLNVILHIFLYQSHLSHLRGHPMLKSSIQDILLMAEILHHLGCMKPYK